MNLNKKVSEARSQLAYKSIARRFNCSAAFVTYAIHGKRNSDKAKEIRAYVRQLVGRNRLAA